MKKDKKKINKWLIWGVIVLATLIILWLTMFEYYGAVEAGSVVKDAENIEAVQGE